jgi:hypothetical protein
MERILVAVARLSAMAGMVNSWSIAGQWFVNTEVYRLAAAARRATV